jgi:1-acyl-sn-glycerol-3-phosphate acyltransferase
MALVTSTVRQLVGLVIMVVAVAIFAVLCTLLLPWRTVRIRTCNVFGHLVGRAILAVTGTRVLGNPKPEMNASMPAIYVSNHTSPIDIFLGIWLSPVGVCGVAKKEVVWYPFFGQLYLISGHLRIDRGNRGRAIEALRNIADLVRENGLGIWIWPEGTRSRDGRLRAFKKGFAHLALATGLPVVPVVVTGAHRIWRKNSFLIHPGEVVVKVLPAVDTSGWTLETLDTHVAEVHRLVNDALPPDQQCDQLAVAAK